MIRLTELGKGVLRPQTIRVTEPLQEVDVDLEEVEAKPPIILRIARNKVLRALLLPGAVLLAWTLVAASHTVSTLFLPTPGQVVQAFRVWIFGKPNNLSWTSGTWASYSLLSARRVGIGFLIGASLGVTIGIVIGWYRLASDLMEPFIQGLRPVPMTAWLPFMTLIFGVSEFAAVALIAAGTFFPIVINTISGARQTPVVLIRAALMLGTSPRKLLHRVVLRAALPSIITGLRLGLGISWVLVIVAEMLAVQGGLGYAVWSAYSFQRMDLIVAAIITIGVFGWASDQILVRVSGRFTRWQRGLVHA